MGRRRFGVAAIPKTRATSGITQREPWRRALLASLPALAFLLGCTPMADFDVWWHLRAGQLVLETGAVPRVDLFTYTNATRPWIDVYWLYQVGLALLYRVGGPSALVLFKAAAAAGVVGLSMAGRRPDHRAWPLALAWLPGLLMVSGRLSERPEAVSLVLLTAFLVLLARAPREPRGLWLLPVLQALWVNCHGFFVAGPLVLVAYAADWAIERLRSPAEGFADARPPLRTFVAAGLLSVLACLVNPYGIQAVTLPLEQFHKIGSTAGIYRATIGEFKTVGDFIAIAGIWNPYLLAYAFAFLLGLASFAACARRAGGRISLFRAVIFAGGAYLAWQATRNSGLFGVIAVLVTTWNLDDVLAARAARQAAPPPRAESAPKKSRRRASAGTISPARRRPEPNAVLLAAVGALALSTVSGALYAWAGEGRRVGLGERSRWFAHDACAFLARPDLPERIAAYNIGQAAVCIAHSAPRHKQFMDPRLEVNTEETFERYLAGMQRLWRNDARWEQALGIDHDQPDEIPAILIERGTLGRAAEILSHDPRWRCVFADQMATVFVTARFAAQHGLPAVPL